MPAEQQFLIRGPDGRMATVLARTELGAMRRYLVNNPRLVGMVSVKLRGASNDDWVEYKVKR